VTKLLVVEDNPINLELVIELLEDDYELETAEDGEAGLAAARRSRPDLIIMDLSLPVLDGWDAIRQLRSDPAFRRIPIIALSAHAATQDIDRAVAAGCDAYVTKPIDDEKLRSTIERLLRGVR